MRRIGLVGFNCSTGNGIQNRQLVNNADIHAWLVINNRAYGCDKDLEGVKTFHRNSEGSINQFLSEVDVVLFIETPFYEGILNKAREQGKRIVCIPNQEWLPQNLDKWCLKVDTFLSPTLHCHDIIKNRLPSIHFQWPYETDRYPYTERTTCEQFVFLNGRGGWMGRKGLHVLEKAKQLWPDMPVKVFSQKQIKHSNLEILPPLRDNRELYISGDVLLLPHSVDGLGLEMLEALCSGMPLITTDGLPWNEFLALRRIKAKITEKKIKRFVEWYKPSAEDLVRVCKEVLHTDIRDHSKLGRSLAEQRSWSKKADEFNSLVRG